jgi:purine-nucleoside phosphorylase
VSTHIEAQPGDVAEDVLLPGDPCRATFIAQGFLEDARRYNEVRCAYGYTGTVRGQRVSVQATGMGIPSVSIYAHELVVDHGARTLVRVGTCGAIRPGVEVGDLVLAMAACTNSAVNHHTFRGMDFAPTASFDLLQRADSAASRRQLKHHVGTVVTSDVFYAPPESWRVWADHGVLAAEMEVAGLYTLAARLGARALAILTVSDHILTGAAMTPREREVGLRAMVELALDVVAP